VPALLTRACLRLGDGDLAGAEVDLLRGLAKDDRNPALWSALASVRAEQRRGDEALEAFARALGLDSRLVSALANRAVLHFEAGRAADAVADLDRALALEPSAELLLNRAVGRRQLGDLDGALADLSAAVDSGEVGDDDVADLRAEILAERSSSTGA
jgi:tetratricopeptide (TPR) repeat protein